MGGLGFKSLPQRNKGLRGFSQWGFLLGWLWWLMGCPVGWKDTRSCNYDENAQDRLLYEHDQGLTSIDLHSFTNSSILFIVCWIFHRIWGNLRAKYNLNSTPRDLKLSPVDSLDSAVFVFFTVYQSSRAYDIEHCTTAVKQWASSSLHSDSKDGHILKDLLFFLHVPRTGGRTYFYCFLKKLYSSSLECPRSYDKLHFDPLKRNCRLLATHDDYSMMSKLPRERTSVVTLLRSPIERVFNARKIKGPSYIYGNDSYNMKEIVMPLHEFINHPVALDLIHNGATFQVAGLTNNSNRWEAHEVRHCVTAHQTLGKYVLDVAKKRLDDMLYVGLTKDHKESAKMFANLVGSQVISELVASNQVTEAGNNTSTVEAQSKNMTVAKLMETYETCIFKLRSSQSKRRINSFKRISPANFTKEARLHVSEGVLKKITLLNSLDVQLYKHAQKIFVRQHQLMEQKLLESNGLDKRMCKVDSGVTYDNNNHRASDEDCFGDIFNIIDLPIESLEGECFAEDWEAKLGPIPAEFFRELAPTVSQTGVANNSGCSMDFPFKFPVLVSIFTYVILLVHT
ncbi:hypothetical protein R6Q57_004877 [Mikania cordata]